MTGILLYVVYFRVSSISLRHQLLLGVSVRSASLEGDQVVHRVFMSVSRQASRLSFHRLLRAVLSAQWYALITAGSQRQTVPENRKCM